MHSAMQCNHHVAYALDDFSRAKSPVAFRRCKVSVRLQTMNQINTTDPTALGWLAKLSLGYQPRRGKTCLTHRQHLGPLLVQKPFYPETSVCHTYLIHPPGGIVGGDRLELDVRLAPGSETLITTPAANKFYQSNGEYAHLIQRFHVADGARLEWLPQETIYFNGAKVKQRTVVHLDDNAQLLFWEMSCLGRRASGEVFQYGHLLQSTDIYRNGQLVFVERNRLLGDQGLYQALNGFQANAVYGTFIISPVDVDSIACLESLRRDGQLFSYTLKGQELIIRFLGQDVRELHRCFRQSWARLRPHVSGINACEPRIWHT